MSEKVIGVIGGSGLYEMEGLRNVKEVKVKTPFGSPSDAYITGNLGNVKMVFSSEARQRAQAYSFGDKLQGEHLRHEKLSVEWLISVSAVGSMKEEIAPGHIVIVDQFFDRTSKRVSTFFGNGIAGHVEFGEPVCGNLSGSSLRCR